MLVVEHQKSEKVLSGIIVEVGALPIIFLEDSLVFLTNDSRKRKSIRDL